MIHIVTAKLCFKFIEELFDEMAKIELEERLRTAVENLFDDKSSEEESLTDFDKTLLLNVESESTKKETLNKTFTALKQIFLFAPGAILLWFSSWGITEGV